MTLNELLSKLEKFKKENPEMAETEILFRNNMGWNYEDFKICQVTTSFYKSKVLLVENKN